MNGFHVPVIKLKRGIVHSCRRNGARSLSFSHPQDLEGKEVIIWCTGDNKGFCSAFKGTVIRVSQNAARAFVLKATEEIKRSQWNFLQQIN